MAVTESSPTSTRSRRPGIEVSISLRTILGVGAVVAVVWALASIANVLLVILVSIFSIAVLEPVASRMERRLGWSRRLCASVLVAAIAVVVGAIVLVLVQAASSGLRDFGHALPGIS